MKALTVKSALLFIILNLFAVIIFASELQFKIKVCKNMNQEQLNLYSPISFNNGCIEIGNFDNYIHVMKAQIELKEKGVYTSEIIAFFHNKPVSMHDAFTLLDNRNEQDKRISHCLTTEDLDQMLEEVQNHDFFYTVQMGVYNEENANAFFNFPISVSQRITTKGFFRYTFGEFKTINDAKDALRMVQDSGLDNAIIIAYDKLARIPLDRAMEKEGQMLEDALAIQR